MCETREKRLTYRISARCLAPMGFGCEYWGSTSMLMVSSAEIEVFLIPTRMSSTFCWSLSSVRRSSVGRHSGVKREVVGRWFVESDRGPLLLLYPSWGKHPRPLLPLDWG